MSELPHPSFPRKRGTQDAPFPSFPRRREPRSGATAARSIPLSPPSAPVLSTVCGGELERGAAPPAINLFSVVPAQAGTSQRRDSAAVHPLSPVCSGPLHRRGGELERGPPHPPINPPFRHSRAGGNLAAARQRRGPSPSSPVIAPVLSTVCGGELERGPPHPPINPFRHSRESGKVNPHLKCNTCSSTTPNAVR